MSVKNVVEPGPIYHGTTDERNGTTYAAGLECGSIPLGTMTARGDLYILIYGVAGVAVPGTGISEAETATVL